MQGLLREQRGETVMKHAVAFCSLPQRTSSTAGTENLPTEVIFSFQWIQAPLVLSVQRVQSFSHFPSLTCSPFLPCNHSHLHHNIKSRCKHTVKHHHACWMQPSCRLDPKHLYVLRKKHRQNMLSPACAGMIQGESKSISSTVYALLPQK